MGSSSVSVPAEALSVCSANLHLQMRQPAHFLSECGPASGLKQEVCVLTQCSVHRGSLGERWCGCASSGIILIVHRSGCSLWVSFVAVLLPSCLGVLPCCPVFLNFSPSMRVTGALAPRADATIGSRLRSSTCAGSPYRHHLE